MLFCPADLPKNFDAFAQGHGIRFFERTGGVVKFEFKKVDDLVFSVEHQIDLKTFFRLISRIREGRSLGENAENAELRRRREGERRAVAARALKRREGRERQRLRRRE